MTKQKFRSSFFIFLLLYTGWMYKGDCQTQSISDVVGPEQQLVGPGGSTYSHDSVAIFDYADDPDGFWMYQPESPKPKEAPVIIFLHGYGAYNPMIYGKWIQHLVRKGNVVVFPRYQKNLISPSPDKFIPNVVTAIKESISILDSLHHITAILDNFALVGHSYGGVIGAGIAADYERYKTPEPKVLMMCSPGSGPFKGGVLKNYEGIPENTKMLVMVSENDHIVGDKLGKVIYNTAKNTKERNLIKQYADTHSELFPIGAGHNECYSLDYALDNGIRNATAKRAMISSRFNTLDFNGYWKLFDALLDCSSQNENCEYAFGNTIEQKSLGVWSDGEKIKELEIFIPDQEISEK